MSIVKDPPAHIPIAMFFQHIASYCSGGADLVNYYSARPFNECSIVSSSTSVADSLVVAMGALSQCFVLFVLALAALLSKL